MQQLCLKRCSWLFWIQIKCCNNQLVSLLIDLKIHPSIVCNCYIPIWCRGVFCWSQSQLSLGEGRIHPGEVASSLQGPSLMAAMQGSNCTPGAIWFLQVQYLAQGHFNMRLSSARESCDLNQRPSNLLYPLSYSCPWIWRWFYLLVDHHFVYKMSKNVGKKGKSQVLSQKNTVMITTDYRRFCVGTKTDCSLYTQ